MNKITVNQDEIETFLDDNIEVKVFPKNELFTVNTIQITFQKNTKLEINASQDHTKLKIKYIVKPSVEVEILDLRKIEEVKVQEEYQLEEKSKVRVIKVYDGKEQKQYSTIYLNGQRADIDYILKTKAYQKQTYHMIVYHKNENTTCHITHHGITEKKGSLIFHVINMVSSGMKGTSIEQENRIITNNDQLNKICPDLIIDEQDVNASHSAHIGDVDEKELFYLQSRGIEEKDARNLLLEAFLFQKIENKKEEIQNFITERR